MDEITERALDRIVETLEDLKYTDSFIADVLDGSKAKPDDVRNIVQKVIGLVENEFDF